MAQVSDRYPTPRYASDVKVEVVGASRASAKTVSVFEQYNLETAKAKDPVIAQMQVATEFVDTNKFDSKKFDKYVKDNNIHGFPVVIFRDVWSNQELGRVTGLVSPEVIAEAGKKVVEGAHPNIEIQSVPVDVSEK